MAVLISKSSLVYPVVGVVSPLNELSLGEPKSNLGVSRLDSIGTVNDVTTNMNAEVTTDGAGLGVERLGGAEHLAAGGDSVVTFPDHGADWTRGSIVDETLEEALG